MSVTAHENRGTNPDSQDPASRIEREGYRIGSLALLTPFDKASALLDMQPIYRLPRAPGWVSGVINHQGRVVPAFDLALLFGIASSRNDRPMLLLLGHKEETTAVTINGIPERIVLTSHDRVESPLLPDSMAGFVDAAYRRGDQIWLDFDHGRFLADAVPRYLKQSTVQLDQIEVTQA